MAETTVHIADLGGHAGGQVAQQESGHVADVLDGDIATQRRAIGRNAEQLAEVLDAAGGQGLDRAGAQAVDADAAAIGQVAHGFGQVTHRSFQAGLGQAHGVVVRDRPHGAQVAQRQQG